MSSDPRSVIRAWLPHLVLLALLAMGCVVLAHVFAPLVEPILLAAALALLTGPFLYVPIDNGLAQALPQMSSHLRRRLASLAATAALTVLLLIPVILMLATTLGGFGGIVDLIPGLLTAEASQLQILENKLTEEINRIDRLYPQIDLSQYAIPQQIRRALEEAFRFGGAFLGFLSAGTGMLAHLVLAWIALTVFYAEGSRMSAALLRFSPLTEPQQERLRRRYRAIMLRLINDTLATALAKGIALATIVWITDHVLGNSLLPFFPLMLLATAIVLLPVLGAAMVWLPLAGLQWSLGNYVAAITIALGCTVADYLLSHLHRRLSRHLDERETWIGFLLFLGLVGGLISFGLKGLVIGPMAVVFVHTIGSFWGPMYGLGTDEDATGRHPADDPGPTADTAHRRADA